MGKSLKNKELTPRRKKNLKCKQNKRRQKDTYTFTRRFYKFLRTHSNHIFFKKLYGEYGNYNLETTDITIDHRRDFLSTLIHEFLHHLHRDWSETRVLKNEKKIINALTIRQIKNILKALANIL